VTERIEDGDFDGCGGAMLAVGCSKEGGQRQGNKTRRRGRRGDGGAEVGERRRGDRRCCPPCCRFRVGRRTRGRPPLWRRAMEPRETGPPPALPTPPAGQYTACQRRVRTRPSTEAPRPPATPSTARETSPSERRFATSPPSGQREPEGADASALGGSAASRRGRWADAEQDRTGFTFAARGMERVPRCRGRPDVVRTYKHTTSHAVTLTGSSRADW